MSAFGPKRTSLVAPHMSAFEGKADITCCDAKSAFDPKRTSHRSNKFHINICVERKIGSFIPKADIREVWKMMTMLGFQHHYYHSASVGSSLE
jgi:hypothetical protein